MKKALALIAAASLVAMASTAMAANTGWNVAAKAGSSIEFTKHNLSVTGVGTVKSATGTQICVYCHTPHNANTAGGPIWNRNQSNITFGTAYQLYSGVGMQAVSYKGGFTSDSYSLFCMSCHDGSSMGGTMIYNTGAALPAEEKAALAAFTDGILKSSKANLTQGQIGGVGAQNADGSLLKTTHPVNFKYVSAAGGDLAAASEGKIIGEKGVDFPLFRSQRDATNTFECSSCHAVHDNSYSPFLRATNEGSTLCLGCHKK